MGSELRKVLQPNLQNTQSSGEIKFGPPAHACTEKVWVGEECTVCRGEIAQTLIKSFVSEGSWYSMCRFTDHFRIQL